MESLPRSKLNAFDMFSVTEAARAVFESRNRGPDQSLPVPRNIDFEPAANAQALHAAVGPPGRQGRQQVDLAFVRLDEHLGNRGRAAEIAVDLERWMIVEQVRQRALGPQGVEMIVRMGPVAEPGKEADDPRPAPTMSPFTPRIRKNHGPGAGSLSSGTM